MMKNYVCKLWQWLLGLLGFSPSYRAIVCEELPDKPQSNTLYLIGEQNVYWLGTMICPCGCEDLIQLAMDPTGRPRWSVSLDQNALPSLHPSVHRKVRCSSHFFLRHGKVVWC